MTRKQSEKENYFAYAQGDLGITSCVYCVHRNNDGLTCEAYQKAIPQKILDMKNDHLEPFLGDNGVQFAPKPGWDIPKRLQREEKEDTEILDDT